VIDESDGTLLLEGTGLVNAPASGGASAEGQSSGSRSASYLRQRRLQHLAWQEAVAEMMRDRSTMS
jgi:hypothetical protein